MGGQQAGPEMSETQRKLLSFSRPHVSRSHALTLRRSYASSTTFHPSASASA
jgi:hypothetical protein